MSMYTMVNLDGQIFTEGKEAFIMQKLAAER